MTTELDAEGLAKLMKLLDVLEEDDDVQRVTTNMEASDEVLASFEG
jgi:transcriptional/translational regulatory protein YebC/TACO1